MPASSYMEDWKQLNAGTYAGGAGLDLTDAELILLCATQADGSYHEDGVGLDFSFYKPRKIARVREALKACGADYSEATRPSYPTQHGPSPLGARFRVMSGALVRKLKGLLGPKMVFGAWVLDMSRAQLGQFLRRSFFFGTDARLGNEPLCVVYFCECRLGPDCSYPV